MKIVETFPERQGMTQIRYESAVEFFCARCKKTKKAKLIAANKQDEKFCNGCYGFILSNKDST